jgi:hypothetical protein
MACTSLKQDTGYCGVVGALSNGHPPVERDDEIGVIGERLRTED